MLFATVIRDNFAIITYNGNQSFWSFTSSSDKPYNCKILNSFILHNNNYVINIYYAIITV